MKRLPRWAYNGPYNGQRQGVILVNERDVGLNSGEFRYEKRQMEGKQRITLLGYDWFTCVGGIFFSFSKFLIILTFPFLRDEDGGVWVCNN